MMQHGCANGCFFTELVLLELHHWSSAAQIRPDLPVKKCCTFQKQFDTIGHTGSFHFLCSRCRSAYERSSTVALVKLTVGTSMLLSTHVSNLYSLANKTDKLLLLNGTNMLPCASWGESFKPWTAENIVSALSALTADLDELTDKVTQETVPSHCRQLSTGWWPGCIWL